MEPRIVHVGHSHGRQHACAHQKVPSTSVILMVVDSVVTSVTQDSAEFGNEPCKMGAPVAHIMNLCTQLPRVVIEDCMLSASHQEIEPGLSTLGQETKRLHQPSLGAAHTERVYDMEHPE